MSGTKILVVEDEVIVAEDIRSSLENMGYVVPSTASSGEEAIKKVAQFMPDLVLMDIVIQGKMDGIETAKEISSSFNIPFVYLTAFSDQKTLERAKITEPFGYIIKPFKERELHINIEIALFKHKMETRLKESKEWFTTTLKSTSDAVIATDPQGCVKFMNPIAQSLTGWGFAEAGGKPLKEVFDIISEKSDKTLENQTVLVSRSKTSIPIEVSSDPIMDEKGSITGIVMVFRDITERKRAMDEIIRLKGFYESVLEGIVNGVWVTDKDDIIVYSNKGMNAVTGLASKEIEGAHVLKDFQEFFRPYYMKARETLQPFYYQAVPFITPDKSTSYQSGWLVPRIKDGKFNGMICTIESIPKH